MNRRDEKIKSLLDEASNRFESPSFIEQDPISIPHLFTRKQDIEIIGFWTAMLAWGQRKSIIRSGNRLVELMDHAPYEWIMGHKEKDRQRFMKFVHRTFQPDDALYFIEFFRRFYEETDSLEAAYLEGMKDAMDLTGGIAGFHRRFFSYPPYLDRTKKHVATPERGSTCKRHCMFLRWMVRSSHRGVDFGLWPKISSKALILPVDVHVHRIAQLLKLTSVKTPNWSSALALTSYMRKLNPQDPCVYDYALFGLSIDPDLKKELLS